jgi:hypothetical protein
VYPSAASTSDSPAYPAPGVERIAAGLPGGDQRGQFRLRLTDISRRRPLEDVVPPMQTVPVHHFVCHVLQASWGCCGDVQRRVCRHHRQRWCARHRLALGGLMTSTVPADAPQTVPKRVLKTARWASGRSDGYRDRPRTATTAKGTK